MSAIHSPGPSAIGNDQFCVIGTFLVTGAASSPGGMWGQGCLCVLQELADSQQLRGMNWELLGLLEGDFEPCLSQAIKRAGKTAVLWMLTIGLLSLCSTARAGMVSWLTAGSSPRGQPQLGGFGTRGSFSCGSCVP